ncbi:MAG: D-tyrosyl-tRNA(Tyr) deacylase [Spirochaetales bacterium]|nr:D-tyrosyl-tRNA(Tyr) deacylase [Spirochaetales bacterium]
MRAVIQRVRAASVTVDGKVTGSIEKGLLVYLGVCDADDGETCMKLASKIARLRIFEDAEGKMNLSVADIGGDVLVVSQFTLYAGLRKGNRPSFDEAGRPELAERLYEVFMKDLEELGLKVEHGMFGAHMHVVYENDGPVTIIADSAQLFGK